MMTSWCQKATHFTRQTILSCSHLSYAPNAKVSCIHLKPRILFPHRAYATESPHSSDEKVDLEIISRDFIKPASPTPYHLRTLSFSAIDQVMMGCYTSFILFIPNTNKTSVSEIVKGRSRRLKESLSELLTQYYPFAEEINNNFHIDCNDKGVYFVEARVSQTLEQFLGQPGVACLNDVIKGGGVEAVVTLSRHEMEIFERDSEILSYATLNPSPLLLV